MAYTYILRCVDDSFYVGSTVDLEHRLGLHNAGEGAAYTRRRRPVRLVYCEEFPRIDDTYLREKQVQGWSRAKRLALVDGRFDGLPRLARSRADGSGVESQGRSSEVSTSSTNGAAGSTDGAAG